MKQKTKTSGKEEKTLKNDKNHKAKFRFEEEDEKGQPQEKS